MLLQTQARTDGHSPNEVRSAAGTGATREIRELRAPPIDVAIIGGGVAGSEAGTFLAANASTPIAITEIEYNNERRFGGWGFQRFPESERTNLALRKMFLGEDPQEILRWSEDPIARTTWPPELRAITLHPDQPFPRVLMREYVAWRRREVRNTQTTFKALQGEAMDVTPTEGGKLTIKLESGTRVTADHVILASGSISVKIPPYLREHVEHPNVIIDPLTADGDQQRKRIAPTERVLVLGTGLTGEEQVNILLRQGSTAITLFSRNGMRHYAYPKEQKNLPLTLLQRPDFLLADTPEEFNAQLGEFYATYLNAGHSPEDILAAIRPHWDSIRAEMGGCIKAAERLRQFRRALATNSIGLSWEVNESIDGALADKRLTLEHGEISDISRKDGRFAVSFQIPNSSEAPRVEYFDHIINAIGRNIIKHPLWDNLLASGLAKKHAGIGVRVDAEGRMIAGDGSASDSISVVGMARAGDHALRHGFLGNSAFNVPQVRSHLYRSMRAVLSRIYDLTRRAQGAH